MANKDLVGRAGEHYVAAELNQRGAYASPWAGNLPGIDIVAMNQQMSSRAYIQVKTKGPKQKDWQSTIREGWDLPNKLECVSSGGCRYDSVICVTRNHKHGDPHPPSQRSIDLNEAYSMPGRPDHYWVFVALKVPPEGPQYWVITDGDVRDAIRRGHLYYLNHNAGHRNTTHHSINFTLNEQDIEPHFRNWSALGLDLTNDRLEGTA